MCGMAGLKLSVVADNPDELIFLPPPPKSCDYANLSRLCFCWGGGVVVFDSDWFVALCV